MFIKKEQKNFCFNERVANLFFTLFHADMKICPVFNNFFGSKKLFTAQILRKNPQTQAEEPIDVFITRLDKSDIERIEADSKNWENTESGDIILNSLKVNEKIEKPEQKENRKFYGIELPQKNGKRKIIAMAYATDSFQDNSVYIDFIQTLKPPYIEEKLKGAGSCLMYAILDMAKNRCAENISLESSTPAIPFYQKLGFDSDRLWHFLAQKEQMNAMHSNLRQKYLITEAEKEKV